MYICNCPYGGVNHQLITRRLTLKTWLNTYLCLRCEKLTTQIELSIESSGVHVICLRPTHQCLNLLDKKEISILINKHRQATRELQEWQEQLKAHPRPRDCPSRGRGLGHCLGEYGD